MVVVAISFLDVLWDIILAAIALGIALLALAIFVCVLGMPVALGVAERTEKRFWTSLIRRYGDYLTG